MISVEYAHIYTNQRISDEHERSLITLKQVSREVQQAGYTVIPVVMIDDYSFPDPTFDYNHFTNWLADQGHKPAVIFRESQLIPLCDQVLDLVQDPRLKQQLVEYITSKKYPCSLFIAAWYLLRLGHITSPLFAPALRAERLINVLPVSFKEYEDKALGILAATPHASCVKNISYKFILE